MSIANIGDNSGSLSAAEQIKENLDGRHGDLLARAAQLSGMDERAPPADSEANANKISEAIRQCYEFEKVAEGIRVQEKEPYLQGGRSVDAYFKNLIDPIAKTKMRLQTKRTEYDIAVERAERQRREEEARIERERWAAAAKEAAEAIRNKAAAEERAVVAEQRAEEAVQATKATSADLTRTRTDSGVVTSLKTVWDFEIVTPKDVPRKFCTPEPGLIRAAVKAAVQPDGSNTLEIKGVRIFQRKVSQVR